MSTFHGFGLMQKDILGCIHPDPSIKTWRVKMKKIAY
jgi:hypothetical protein